VHLAESQNHKSSKFSIQHHAPLLTIVSDQAYCG